jgi:uncharacterized protein (UPF0276 family)
MSAPRFRHPDALGIGFPYLPSFPAEFYRHGGPLDFIELTPEGLCQERREGGERSLELVPSRMSQALGTCGHLPTVIHGVELSIGAAHGWNDAYVHLLDELSGRWPFVWHSEHLGFQTIPDGLGGSIETGVPLPLPPTLEAAELVATRAALLMQRYEVPFLLENAAHYLPEVMEDPLAEEPAFLNEILARSGCGLLLDLHNLYCNATNHGFEAQRVLEQLDLERVVEIHVAGGAWAEGFLMDSHGARVPDQVWELLEFTLARAPGVLGVVYEILEETARTVTPDVAAEEMTKVRRCWQGKKLSTRAYNPCRF